MQVARGPHGVAQRRCACRVLAAVRSAGNKQQHHVSAATPAQPSSKLVYTPNQKTFLRMVQDSHVTVLYGPAGTGKTRCAVDAGIQMLHNRQIKQLVITRPAVCVQEDHGFLPGSIEEKMRPWMMPIYDALRTHFSQHEIDAMLREHVVEISPLAYMRGRTFADSFVICDEAQNCTATQLKMVITRIGLNSRMVITGDPDQDDLALSEDGSRQKNGLADLLDRMDRHGVPEGVGLQEFDTSDICRHAVLPGILYLYR